MGLHGLLQGISLYSFYLFFHPPVTPSPLGANIPLSTLSLNTLGLFLALGEGTGFHTHAKEQIRFNFL
jgi:hypothetical protein